MIVQSNLPNSSKNFLNSLVEDIHVKITEVTCDDKFSELEPYAEIAIRDLLKLLDLMKHFF